MRTTLDDLVAAAVDARDADTRVADIAADLLADGVSLSELARTLGVARQSVTERVSVTPGYRELLRALSRVGAWYDGQPVRGVRVSTAGRFVVFAMSEAFIEHAKQTDATCWRIMRHTPQPADAEQLAAYLGRESEGAFKYVRRPRDLDPDNVLGWRL